MTPAGHMSTQITLVCSEIDAPVADAVVLRGTLDEYADPAKCRRRVVRGRGCRQQLQRNTGEKLAGYARAGVAQYIVVNLRNRTAEVYTNPDAAAGTYPAAAGRARG